MPEPERQRFAANILDHSQRLARMIDMTLALAAVEHRQAIEQAEAFDLAALVRDAASAFEPQFAASGVVLRIDAPPRPIRITGDRFLVGQAIRNLLQNAQEFSPRGGTIVVSLRIEESDAVFAVRDQGPGVPDFALPKVFDRFYSLARPDGQRSSGLGLCFVREVASLHQGTATLANEPAGGAIATLRMPCSVVRGNA
jgi:two-component system sensor histidine kinase CreC